MRYSVSYPHRNDAVFGFVQTHLRADGILVGILISYLYYFTNFNHFFLRFKYVFLLTAMAFILPAFVYKGGSFFMNTWGLSLVNLGFGIITLWSINTKIFLQKWSSFISGIFAFIGLHSYSIYLWHINALHFTEKFLDQKSIITSFVFFISSIIIGAFFSIIIEKPFLKIRDRITE